MIGEQGSSVFKMSPCMPVSTSAPELARCLSNSYGGAGNLIVRDGDSASELRNRNEADTERLCAWIDSGRNGANGVHGSSGDPNQLRYNVGEAADKIRVGQGFVA